MVMPYFCPIFRKRFKKPLMTSSNRFIKKVKMKVKRIKFIIPLNRYNAVANTTNTKNRLTPGFSNNFKNAAITLHTCQD